MRTITVADAIERIRELSDQEPRNGALAFDGDGTLWAGDIGEDFFAALVDHGLHEASHDALIREAAAEAVDTSGSVREVAHRVHAAYLAGTFPEERVCEIMTWAAAGMTRAALDEFCAAVVHAIGLPHRLHPEALRIIEFARSAQIDVHLVSASPRAVVEQAARLVGIDPTMVMAAREHVDSHGVVQCSVERPIPYGEGKVSHLRKRLGARTLYAAFGDNAFDVPMLCEASLPFAIRPKQRLLDRAHAVDGLMVLERLEP